LLSLGLGLQLLAAEGAAGAVAGRLAGGPPPLASRKVA
jgi:hypothetical protein